MMLRTLVANFLREQAKEQLYTAARESLATPEPAEDAAPPPPSDVAVLFALGVEAGGLVDLLREPLTTRSATLVEHVGWLGERRVVVAEVGLGQASHALIAEVLATHPVKYVIAAGFAAGLTTPLKRGHFLIADEVVDLHGHRVAVDLHVRRESLVDNPALHVGRLLTVDHPLRTAAERHRLGDNHAALASDMESLGIAQMCHERHVRFLAVRIIHEAVDDELARDMERLLEQKSLAGKLGAAAGALWNRPSTIKEMWQLKEDAIQASDRLARFLTGVVANLPLPPG